MFTNINLNFFYERKKMKKGCLEKKKQKAGRKEQFSVINKTKKKNKKN